MDVPPVLRRIRREHGEDEVEELHQFTHIAVSYIYSFRLQRYTLILTPQNKS